MSSLPGEQVPRGAARKVLCAALKLKSGDRIALFYDESTEEVANFFCEAASDLGVQFQKHLIRIAEQKAYALSQDGSPDLEFLAGYQAVLTCLTDNAECALFRQHLVTQCVAEDRKVGHMPGVNEEILREALNIDYSSAEQICDDLALILAVGRFGVLDTSAITSAGHMVRGTLKLDLGGISRPSIVSSGVVPVGTWGNLPGGETFIAPIEAGATGDFIITGSFENRVLHPQEFVILHFADGRLQSIDGSPEIREEFANLLEKWKKSDALNYSNLAELGIGINERIRSLTGRALFDEKCSDTVHIALGSNYGYGGTVYSSVHKDLISWHPTLTIDGHPILTNGKRVYDRATCRENIDEVEPSAAIKTKTFVGRSADIRCEHAEDGTLRVRRAVSSGRLCLYTIGDTSTSKDLSLLYKLLPPAAFNTQFDELASRAVKNLGWKKAKVACGLTILQRHGAIAVSDGG